MPWSPRPSPKLLRPPTKRGWRCAQPLANHAVTWFKPLTQIRKKPFALVVGSLGRWTTLSTAYEPAHWRPAVEETVGDAEKVGLPAAGAVTAPADAYYRGSGFD